VRGLKKDADVWRCRTPFLEPREEKLNENQGITGRKKNT